MVDYSLHNDHHLVSLLTNGDQQAFREIYVRYTGPLYRHAYTKLQDTEEARDMVQELFVTLWDRHDTISPTTNLAGYLHTALRNRILNYFAHQRTVVQHLTSLQAFIDRDVAEADHLVRLDDLSTAFEQELANLPDKMREVFVLSRQEHLSHREIAEQLGLSEKTVRNHVNNALKILRARLLVEIITLWLLCKA